MMINGSGPADAANAARLARRHLTQETMIDGYAPPGDAGELDDGLLTAGTHVTRKFSERTFLLAITGADNSFQDNLGVGRHFEIDGLATDQRHGFAAQAASDAELIG